MVPLALCALSGSPGPAPAGREEFRRVAPPFTPPTPQNAAPQHEKSPFLAQ